MSGERETKVGGDTLTHQVSNNGGPEKSYDVGKHTLTGQLDSGQHPASERSTVAPPQSASVPHSIDAISGADLAANHESRSASERAIDLARLGLVHLGAMETTLVPAYSRAIAAVDTAAVKTIIAQIVGGVMRIVDAHEHIVRLVPQSDASRHAANASTATTDPFTPNPAEFADLMVSKSALDAALSTTLPKLAVQVSPQMFGEQPVSGTIETPPAKLNIVVCLVAEANLVIELLETADAIEALVMPTNAARGVSEPASDDARQDAVGRLAHWKSRPINYLFLARVLTHRGLWQSLQGAKSLSGETTSTLDKKVAAQAAETGTTADVGSWWDADEAREHLDHIPPPGAVTIDSTHAMHVFEMLARAEPRARAGLIKQLERMGRLGRLCKQLPWGHVKQLWESIDDAEASKLLEPYWADKGGGKSLGKRLREQDHWYTDALDKLMNYGTLGAKPQIDEAYDAREAGLISDDEYVGALDKAVGRAALVMTAMAATGGLAGEFGAGAAEGFGLGRAGSALASGAAAGAVGSVGGHLVGDAYDQALNGKEGFDPLSAYGHSFLMGGVVGAGLSFAAAKYLPPGSRTVGQQAATTHPAMTHILEAARGAGKGTAVEVRMTVRKFIELIGGGDGGAPPGLKLAYAGAGDGAIPSRIASAPPESNVWVIVRPLKDLDAPQATQRVGDDDVVELDFEPPEREPSFGDEASHTEGEAEGSVEIGERALPDGYKDLAEHAGGVSVRSAREAGVVPRAGAEPMDQHHIFPQSGMEVNLPDGTKVFVGGRAWFKERGIDIDQHCVDLSDFVHDEIHGVNQSLAQKYWREWEWRSAISDELAIAEAQQAAMRGDPNYKLTPDKIWTIANVQRERFGIADRPVVPYQKGGVR